MLTPGAFDTQRAFKSRMKLLLCPNLTNHDLFFMRMIRISFIIHYIVCKISRVNCAKPDDLSTWNATRKYFKVLLIIHISSILDIVDQETHHKLQTNCPKSMWYIWKSRPDRKSGMETENTGSAVKERWCFYSQSGLLWFHSAGPGSSQPGPKPNVSRQRPQWIGSRTKQI